MTKKFFALLPIIIVLSINTTYASTTYVRIEGAELEAAMNKLNAPYSAATKSKLDSMGWSAIRAAAKNDYDTAGSITRKMMMNGAESVSSPNIRSYDPTCPYSVKPEITLNGKKLKGNTCVKLSYKYKNKTYDLGYCK